MKPLNRRNLHTFINRINIYFLGLVLFIICGSQLSYSQAVVTDMGSAGMNASTGRGVGSAVDYTSYKQLEKIRDYINKGDNKKAANRAIRMIKQMESGRSTGMQSQYYGPAYNELCLSSTNLRKVEYAMEVCNKSLSIIPDNWESLKSRATLYFMIQDYSNSLNDFKKSLENAPADNEGVIAALKQNIAVVESKIQ